MTRHHARPVRAFVAILSLLAGIFLSAQTPPSGDRGQAASERLHARADRNGRVRVLVELKLAAGRHVPEGRLRAIAEMLRQRNEIVNAFARVDAPSDAEREAYQRRRDALKTQLTAALANEEVTV